jgi:hypothetical protein
MHCQEYQEKREELKEKEGIKNWNLKFLFETEKGRNWLISYLKETGVATRTWLLEKRELEE